MKNEFITALGSKKRLYFDGSMGALLQSRGLAVGETPESWNLINPQAIKSVHSEYLAAGSTIALTNTFGGVALDEKTITAGIDIAAEAVNEAGQGLVAFDLGPTGQLLAPMGDLPFDEAVKLFAKPIQIAEKSGKCDLIALETFSDLYEAKAAMIAVKEHSCLPFVVTFTLTDNSSLFTGGGILEALLLAQSLGASATGFNCGRGAEDLPDIVAEIEKIRKYVSIPIALSPNAGVPFAENGKTIFPTTSEEFGQQMTVGAPIAQILGGCCGTTPEHIKAMVEACNDVPITPAPEQSDDVVITSYGKSVVVGKGKKPVIVGERLNPTGKLALKEAYRTADFAYIQKLALSQIAAGADILDINAGLPDIGEAEVLERAITEIQSITDTPLCIDTSNPAAAERALRAYNGRPLLNSINAKPESIKDFMPLAKKYGAAIVALALDESGIPSTPNERIEAANAIEKSAEEHDIMTGSIVADMLTLAISTDPNSAKITLEAVENSPYPTILGVSNISFGLPNREILTSSFLTMALQNGLCAAIVNPESPAISETFLSSNALSGFDENFESFISSFNASDKSRTKQVASTEISLEALKNAIVSGLKTSSIKIANSLISAGESPLTLINDGVVPALSRVGELFEQKKLYLPSLLSSADAATAASGVIKKAMPNTKTQADEIEKIVLATVKGDIHDIGKNIVKMLLESYGFSVIDLGRDVEPELVADTVKKHNCKLCGLSALMTTTVSNMEKTIRLLRKECPNVKIMVGGAVLTESYAMAIGADYYSADALGAVKIVQKNRTR